MPRKAKPHEEHENHERWMVSYADFMTLLFALFVVMYASSRADVKKVRQVVESVRFATHFAGTGGSGALPLLDGPSSGGGSGLLGGASAGGASGAGPTGRARRLQSRLEQRLQTLLADQPEARAVTVRVEGRRLTVRMAADGFFDPGQAALRPQSLALVDAVAEELLPLERLVRVEGHSDEVPYAGARYRNDWELSSARAATVVTYLEAAHQARRGLLAATGWGSTRPAVEGDSPEARARNRRVELVLELDPEEDGGEARGAP